MLSLLTIALVATIRAQSRTETGADRIRGWHVLVLAALCLAAVYVLLRFAPAEASLLVGGYIAAVGVPAVARDVAAPAPKVGP